MPLSMMSAGDACVIHRITGKDEIRRHLAELGFVVGETVTVVSVLGGNMIVSIKDGRVAIDKELAARIMV